MRATEQPVTLSWVWWRRPAVERPPQQSGPPATARVSCIAAAIVIATAALALAAAAIAAALAIAAAAALAATLTIFINATAPVA